MSEDCKHNLNAILGISLLHKKQKDLDMRDCIKIVSLSINYKSPTAVLKKEKTKNVIFAKQLQTEARKAKLKSLYGTDDPRKIKFKTRREYIEEFIMNTLNDSTFISIN